MQGEFLFAAGFLFHASAGQVLCAHGNGGGSGNEKNCGEVKVKKIAPKKKYTFADSFVVLQDEKYHESGNSCFNDGLLCAKGICTK